MKKSKLTGREVIMVVFLVVLLVGVCYYLLFLTPLKKDIADINNQISEAESPNSPAISVIILQEEPLPAT